MPIDLPAGEPCPAVAEMTPGAGPQPMHPGEHGERRGAVDRRGPRSVVVVHPPDELDVASADCFRAALLAEDPHVDLVVEMGSITYFGAAAIGALVAVRERLDAEGGTLTLRRPPTTVQRVLAICGELERFAVTGERAVVDGQDRVR